MKRLVLGGSGVVGTGAMILLAMALAQRDARIEQTAASNIELPYVNQTAEGIALDPMQTGDDWRGNPVVRGNDSLPGSSTRNVDPNNPFRSPAAFVAFQANRNANASGGLAEPPPMRSNFAPLPSTKDPLPPLPSTLPSGMAAPSANSTATILPPTNLPSTSLPPFNESAPLPPNNLRSGASSRLSDDRSGSAMPAPEMPEVPSMVPSASSALPSSPFSSPRTMAMDDRETALNSSTGPLNGSNGQLSGSAGPSAGTSGPATARIQPPAMSSETLPPISAPSYEETSELPPTSLTSSPSPASLPPSLEPDRMVPPSPRSNFNAPVPSAMDAPVPTRSTSMSGNATGPGPGAAVSAGGWSGFASSAPGTRHLDGSQNPSMEIQKRAPAEVQVGIPATFTLLVRNVGSATAYDVAVHDAVPKGAKLVRTNPQSQSDANGKILWKLGEIPAGSEQILTIELIPESEGELGSVASVTFAAQASVRTMSTQPKLQVKQLADTSVLGGDSVRVTIEVTNIGTGTARNVELEEDVPAIMRHSTGVSSLAHTIGDLAPGESERVEIELQAVSAGKAVNKVRAISSNTAPFESSATIDVVLPKLVLQMEGPRLRYLERQATYRATITNSGTAIAQNVELLLHLPRGMEFNSAANEGTYLPDQHAVAWSLAELSAGTTATTEVALLPVQEGDFVLRMQGVADGVRADAIDKKVQVEGQSELAFSVEDDNDPIETDGFTTYIVRVTNTGTRIDTDVQLAIELPEGAKAEQINAPVNYQVNQRAIVFAPLPQMQSKDQQVYRVSVRHSREGTHVLRAQLKSKNRPVAVTKEESTQVYLDQ